MKYPLPESWEKKDCVLVKDNVAEVVGCQPSEVIRLCFRFDLPMPMQFYPRGHYRWLAQDIVRALKIIEVRRETAKRYVETIKSRVVDESALLVAELIAKHCVYITGTCVMSRAKIAEETGLQERDADQAIYWLADHGWLTMQGQGRGGRKYGLAIDGGMLNIQDHLPV